MVTCIILFFFYSVASTFYCIKRKMILEPSDSRWLLALMHNIPSYTTPINITEKENIH